MVKLLGKKRRRTHAAVEHERLLSLVNSMGDGVIAVDQDLHVVLSNGAALNILDVNSSLHDKPIQSIFKPLDKNNQPVDIVKLIRDSKIPTTSRDLHLKYEDGSIVDLYVSIAPVHLGFGEHGLRGFVLLMRDITREKSLEEERDEFISVVSHELRTPLAITEGNISNAQFIVERNKDITSVKKALQEAHDQVLFLSSMVNDLATLSRAERGKLTVEIESIDVPALLQQLADNYASDVKKKAPTVYRQRRSGSHNTAIKQSICERNSAELSHKCPKVHREGNNYTQRFIKRKRAAIYRTRYRNWYKQEGPGKALR